MPTRKPPWLYLHEALDRVSARLFQRPIEALPRTKSLKVRYTLRDLLQAGDIESYVLIKNRMVRLTVPVMLRSPFGIHYDGDIPGIEISKWPGQLLSLSLKASDLESSLNTRFPGAIEEPKPKSPSEKNEEAKRWLVTEMRRGTRLTKTHCQKIILARFKISRKAFLDIWPKAQNEAGVNWSRPGRFETV
jgi:hypothetical protein